MFATHFSPLSLASHEKEKILPSNFSGAKPKRKNRPPCTRARERECVQYTHLIFGAWPIPVPGRGPVVRASINVFHLTTTALFLSRWQPLEQIYVLFVFVKLPKMEGCFRGVAGGVAWGRDQVSCMRV